MKYAASAVPAMIAALALLPWLPGPADAQSPREASSA